MFCDVVKGKVFHNWSKWKIFEKGELQSRDLFSDTNQYRITGKYNYQSRTCENCGLNKIKKEQINF